jgi:nucleoside 2-deoxyribosyltransferase
MRGFLLSLSRVGSAPGFLLKEAAETFDTITVMKIYVAGKDISRATAVMETLKEAGHTITYDWAHDFDSAEDFDEKQTQELAVAERKGVQAADVLVYLWEDDQESARYEVGMAMGLEKPIVVVAQESSLFFWLPEVTHVDSDEEIIDALKAIK